MVAKARAHLAASRNQEAAAGLWDGVLVNMKRSVKFCWLPAGWFWWIFGPLNMCMTNAGPILSKTMHSVVALQSVNLQRDKQDGTKNHNDDCIENRSTFPVWRLCSKIGTWWDMRYCFLYHLYLYNMRRWGSTVFGGSCLDGTRQSTASIDMCITFCVVYDMQNMFPSISIQSYLIPTCTT